MEMWLFIYISIYYFPPPSMWCVWANAGVSPPQCLSQALLALNMTFTDTDLAGETCSLESFMEVSTNLRNHLHVLLEIHCQQAVKKRASLFFYISVHITACPPLPSLPPDKEMEIKLCLQLQSCICALYKPHSTIEGGHTGLELSKQFCNTSGHLSVCLDFWAW